MLALLRCGCWLALVSVAKSWSVTIDSADDLVCKGGAGFSKYVRSPLGWLAVLPATGLPMSPPPPPPGSRVALL